MKVLEEVYECSSEYQIIMPQRAAYSAQEIVECLRFPDKDLAKVVLLKDADRLLIAVLPADKQIDLQRLKEILRTTDLRMATEGEFGRFFSDGKAESTSPLGDLYNTEVYVDECLAENEEILHFASLIWPKVGEFCLKG